MKGYKSAVSLSSDSSNNSPKMKKRNEISIFTILSGIERDISDLIQQSQIRSHKTKLFSINETIKTNLLKKLSNYNELVADHEELQRLKQEYAAFKENSNKEIDKLKKEIEFLKKSLSNLNNSSNPGQSYNNVSSNSDLLNILNEKDTKKDEIIKKYLNRIDTLNRELNEERNKNNKLTISLKQSEENCKTALNDYNTLLTKQEKKDSSDQNEKLLTELRKSVQDYKGKYEDVVKINQDLKSRLIDNETNLRNITDEMKSLVKRNSALHKKIEEIELEKEKISSDLSYKEERLQALRQMNSKLESKSSQILKKWETFRLFEEKSNQVSNNCNKLLEIIEDLNRKLVTLIEENSVLKQNLESLNNEYSNQQKKNDELNEQIKLILVEKDELYQKALDLEFRKPQDSQKVDKESLKEQREKKYSTNSNYNSKFMKEKNILTDSNKDFLKLEENNTKSSKLFRNEPNILELKNQ